MRGGFSGIAFNVMFSAFVENGSLIGGGTTARPAAPSARPRRQRRWMAPRSTSKPSSARCKRLRRLQHRAGARQLQRRQLQPDGPDRARERAQLVASADLCSDFRRDNGGTSARADARVLGCAVAATAGARRACAAGVTRKLSCPEARWHFGCSARCANSPARQRRRIRNSNAVACRITRNKSRFSVVVADNSRLRLA